MKKALTSFAFFGLLLIFPYFAFASPYEMSEYSYSGGSNNTTSTDSYDKNSGYYPLAQDNSDSVSPVSINPPKKTYIKTITTTTRVTTRSVGERKLVIDPNKHTWAAYDSNGKLLRTGIVTAGAKWCADINRRCKTQSGVFRIQTLGSASCVSSKFPIGEGGAPMPYCMYFNGGQAIHGSYEVSRSNRSHGCVRVTVSDARWLRFNFLKIGTKVVVKPY
jgi:lipoprotein-anchoring transpeptidase ErfK/SrfK